VNIAEHLQLNYPGRVVQPQSLAEIPENTHLVYILAWDDKPIVTGRGQFNRARVLFDNRERRTAQHIKSLIVRLHQLFGGGEAHAARFLVLCDSKAQSEEIEADLHAAMGGNHRTVPPHILSDLFMGIAPHTTAWLLLNQALLSSFDGQNDLLLWQRKGLISPGDWDLISRRLHLA